MKILEETVRLGRSIQTHFFEFSVYLLLLLMPLSFGWPIGQPASLRVLGIFVTPHVFVTDLPLMLVILAGISWMRKPIRKPSRITYVLVGIVLLGWIALPFTRNPELAAYFAVRWSLNLLLFLVIRGSRLSPRQVAAVLASGLVFQTLIGVGQFLAQRPLGVPGELAVPAEIGGAAIVETMAGRLLRAYGLTFHPNVLGGFLVVGLLMLLPLVKSWAVRIAWWVMLGGMMLTFSRSAWLAGLILLGPTSLGIFLWGREARRPLSILLGGGILAVLMGTLVLAAPVRTRLLATPMETERASIEDRLEMYHVAIDMIGQNGLLGVGPGLYPLEVSHTYPGVNPDPVHNVPLLLGAETGTPGAILWLAIFMIAMSRFFSRIIDQSPWSLALLSACLALGVISLFDFYPWGLEAGRLLMLTTLAMADKELDVPARTAEGDVRASRRTG